MQWRNASNLIIAILIEKHRILDPRSNDLIAYSPHDREQNVHVMSSCQFRTPRSEVTPRTVSLIRG